jgi:zinc/manganese transport system permease protein
MFSGFMVNAWEAATIVAAVAGVVGFFTVIRGAAFAAHALPNGAFAGAAGASLIGVNVLVGLGVFSLAGALTIAGLARRARRDVATAMTIVMMLALGALFLSQTTEYAPVIFSLLFGEVLGVSSSELIPTAAIAALCIVAILILYRPLLMSSVLPDVAAARGVSFGRMELLFLFLVALATTMAVPVVGSLLIFSLLIGPAAAARSFTSQPLLAIGLSVVIALGTVWSAVAISYQTNLPIGFFVGTISAFAYAIGRGWAAWRRTAPRTGRMPEITSQADSGTAGAARRSL